MTHSPIRTMLLALAGTLVLVGCGSSTTKTVIRVATQPGTGTTSSATTTTVPTTATTTVPTTATTTTAPNPTTTAGGAGPVFFQGVDARSAQRPVQLQLTGDGTLFVSGVQWTSWGGPSATGSGNAQYHGCTPDCAQAPSHTALVAIQMSRVRVCRGRQYYSSVVLKLNSGKLLDGAFLQRSWSPC